MYFTFVLWLQRKPNGFNKFENNVNNLHSIKAKQIIKNLITKALDNKILLFILFIVGLIKKKLKKKKDI